MSGPTPRYFYRVLPNGTGSYWEIVDSENGVVARGVASDQVLARADVFQAAFAAVSVTPEPYPEGAKWPNISST